MYSLKVYLFLFFLVACPYGFFGQNCNEKCKNKCTGCNNVNGVCDRGCQPGWKGDYCDIACDSGSYGANCSKTCGQCRDKSQCVNTNGTCLTGCDDGYEGEMCKRSSCSAGCPSGLSGRFCNESSCYAGCPSGLSGRFCNEISCYAGCASGLCGRFCNESNVDFVWITLTINCVNLVTINYLWYNMTELSNR
eukprot:XP_019927251.1 PREDICTED: scavenger receptor class F member 2-like [Crassostrea gigas]